MSEEQFRYRFNVAVYSDEHLDRARALVKLAESSSDPDDVTSLSGAALLFAVAHLSQAAEALLVQALVQNAGRSQAQSEREARRQIEGLGLPARLELLPQKLGLRLNKAWPRPRRLFAAVRLRNKLAHMEGVVFVGAKDVVESEPTPSDKLRIQAQTEHDLRIQVQSEHGEPIIETGALAVPRRPWGDVTNTTGVDAIADVESYLDDLVPQRLASGGASEFFSVIGNAVH